MSIKLHYLFFVCLVATSSAVSSGRALQDADCGQILGTLTSGDIRSIGKSFLSQFLTTENDQLQTSTNIIFLPANYDINIVKLCASCQDHADWYYERNSLVFPGYHAIYCDENDRTIYEARGSAIALIPQYESNTTHGLPVNTKLRTFLSMPPTQIKDDGTVMASSENFLSLLSTWKTNWTSLIGTNFYSSYIPGLAAASAGSIALFPDYLSSTNPTVGRTIFRKRAYEHATAVSYLALERYVMETSSKCTLLDKAVTVYGNDLDAAYGASLATLVLQRFGVACLGAFLSTGILDLSIMLQDILRDSSMTNQTSGSPATDNMKLWVQLAAYTIASTDRQFDTDVNWISDTYRDELQGMYSTESTTTDSNSSSTGSVSILSTTNLPGSAAELFHPAVVDALRTYNSSDWDDLKCDKYDSLNLTSSVTIASNGTDSNITVYEKIICQLRAQYSVYQVLLGQTDRPWISNISACYSNLDEIISGTNQYEHSGIVQNEKFVTQYWKRYTQPIGADALAVTNQNHATTVQLCTMSPLLFLTLDGHRPVNMEEWGNFAPPMTSDESLQCAFVATPSTPTTGDIPTPAPANPTIVAQPGDSNPTIVSPPTTDISPGSEPTDISPGDSNPTVVSKPSVESPTKDIEIEGTPSSNEDDANDGNEGKPNSNTSGVSQLPKPATYFQMTSVLVLSFIVLAPTRL